MPRQVRIEYAKATYHVMCRGNRQEAIFWDERDWEVRCDARRSQIAATLHAQTIIPLAWTTQALLMGTPLQRLPSLQMVYQTINFCHEYSPDPFL